MKSASSEGLICMTEKTVWLSMFWGLIHEIHDLDQRPKRKIPVLHDKCTFLRHFPTNMDLSFKTGIWRFRVLLFLKADLK